MLSSAISKPLMVVAGVSVLLGVGFAAGHNWCTSGQQGAIHGSIDDGKEKVQAAREVIKWREKKVTVYVDKIKTVHDTTGCADTPIEPVIDDELYQVYRLTRGPEAHRAVPVRGVPASDATGNEPK